MGTAVSVLRPRADSPPPSLPPGRAALAAAIVAHRECRQEREAVEVAIAAARTAQRAAVDRRAAAAEGVEAAKSAAVDHLTAAALGRPGEPPQSISAARRALVDAEDEVEAAQAVMDGLAQRRDGLRSPEWTESRVQSAAATALTDSAEAAALVDEVTQLQRQLLLKGAALRFLAERGNFEQFSPAAVAVRRMYSPPTTWNELAKALPDGAAPWREAYAALQVAATAPLPDPRGSP